MKRNKMVILPSVESNLTKLFNVFNGIKTFYFLLIAQSKDVINKVLPQCLIGGKVLLVIKPNIYA